MAQEQHATKVQLQHYNRERKKWEEVRSQTAESGQTETVAQCTTLGRPRLNDVQEHDKHEVTSKSRIAEDLQPVRIPTTLTANKPRRPHGI